MNWFSKISQVHIFREEDDPDKYGFQLRETCCICNQPTPFWTVLADRSSNDQVALCEKCAQTTPPQNIPTAKEWSQAMKLTIRKSIQDQVAEFKRNYKGGKLPASYDLFSTTPGHQNPEDLSR